MGTQITRILQMYTDFFICVQLKDLRRSEKSVSSACQSEFPQRDAGRVASVFLFSVCFRAAQRFLCGFLYEKTSSMNIIINNN